MDEDETVENRVKSITIRLDEELLDALDRIGVRDYRIKKNRNQVVRLLIEDAIKKEEG